MIEILSKYTSAETYFILKEADVGLKELMKYTLMDLLFKRVLEMNTEHKNESRGEKAKVYNYVRVGREFTHYKPLPHEMIYLSPYYKSKSIRILFQHLISMGIQNAGAEKKYIQNNFLKREEMKHLFVSSRFAIFFTRLNLSDRGKAEKERLLQALGRVDVSLVDSILNVTGKGRSDVSTIGGNIFLLEKARSKVLQKISYQLKEDLQRSVGNYDFMTWITFESYEMLFNTIFDELNSSNTGSDSGCNSCSILYGVI